MSRSVIDPSHPDDEPTPTVRELWAMKNGTVEAVDYDKEGRPTRFRLLPAGHALLNGIMRRNAERALARGVGATHREAVEAMRRARMPVADKKKGKSNGRKSAWTEA